MTSISPRARRNAPHRISLRISLAFALLTSLVPSHALATPADAQDTYTFAFRDAAVSQIAQAILGEIGLAYTIDPSVTGRMSFRIDQRLTKAQLLQAFEAALAANNIALVRDGESVIVTAKAKAMAVAGVRPADSAARGAGYEVVAVPLSYVAPSEVAKALEEIAGAGSVIHASDKLGLLILGGSGAELKSTLETVKLFDQSRLQSSKIRWFELSQAPASLVATELDNMLDAAGVGGVSVVPLKRLNGLIVFGRTNEALEDVSQWVFRLDTPAKETASSLWVYHPQNTSAEALSRTLNSLGSSEVAIEAAPTPRAPSPTEDGQDGAVAVRARASAESSETSFRTSVDKESNTLLVSAPAWQWTKLQKILNEIDRPQGQVAIEATVLEVTLSNEFRLGVDWSVLASNHLAFNSVQNEDGVIGAKFPGFSITFLDDDVQAAINALSGRTGVEVLSAPKVVTLNNHPARLEVGDQVPIVTQKSQGTETPGAPVINTIDYRNSGVILSVTPRISGGNRVTLDINQEVSSAVQTRSSSIDSPTIQQRKLESTLVLNDGGVVALGGLISRSLERGDSGVPGLKDIPGVGALFRASSHDEKRTELIVLLRARILRDDSASARILTDFVADMGEIKRRGLLHDGQ